MQACLRTSGGQEKKMATRPVEAQPLDPAPQKNASEPRDLRCYSPLNMATKSVLNILVGSTASITNALHGLQIRLQGTWAISNVRVWRDQKTDRTPGIVNNSRERRSANRESVAASDLGKVAAATSLQFKDPDSTSTGGTI